MRQHPGRHGQVHHYRKAKHPRTAKLIEVDESDHLDEFVGHSRVGQELLGLSDGQLREMYDNATQFLEMQHCEGALHGFTLLCQLHPYIPDFWLGLGRARRLSGQPEQALSAFLMAETMDCHRADIYTAAVECYLELNDPKGAFRTLKRAHKHIEDVSVTSEQKRVLERELIRLDRLVETMLSVKQHH